MHTKAVQYSPYHLRTVTNKVLKTASFALLMLFNFFSIYKSHCCPK